MKLRPTLMAAAAPTHAMLPISAGLACLACVVSFTGVIPSAHAGVGSDTPTTGWFENPIIPGFHPDPSMCRVGGDFYLVTSSFEYFPGVPIFHSRDLVHWEQIGHVLTDDKQLDLRGVPSSGGIYAPTIRCARDQFVVITTLVRSPTHGGNFYVTARDPRGPWSQPIWIDHEGFDPSLLFADGKVYYSRDGKGRDFSHPQIHQTTIDLATGRLLDPLRPIWAGTGGVWPEGAHVYKRRDRYYLLAAEGGTEYDHTEVAARANSPFGPFEPNPHNPILSHRTRPDHPIQALGHADLVDLDDGTTWAVFLGVRAHDRHQHLGRETFLAPVTWTADGWPVIGNAGSIELRMAAPRLPSHDGSHAPARDDFEHPTLGPAWSFVRNPDARDLSLTARRGFLRLVGSPVTLDDLASPALVGQRQPALDVRCRAALDFSPRASNEEAGLTVRASEAFRIDLAVRATSTGREAVLSQRVAGNTTVVGRAPIAPGPVHLDLGADRETYHFAVESAGKTTALGALPTRTLSAEDIFAHGTNHFTGAFIALYATGHGQRSTTPADFDWFECLPSR